MKVTTNACSYYWNWKSHNFVISAFRSSVEKKRYIIYKNKKLGRHYGTNLWFSLPHFKCTLRYPTYAGDRISMRGTLSVGSSECWLEFEVQFIQFFNMMPLSQVRTWVNFLTIFCSMDYYGVINQSLWGRSVDDWFVQNQTHFCRRAQERIHTTIKNSLASASNIITNAENQDSQRFY